MRSPKRTTSFVLAGLLLSLLLAGVVSNFASGSPDGLDSASTEGCTLNDAGEITGGDCVARNARDHELDDSPLADYGIRGIDNAFLSTGLAGMAGVLLTFAIGVGVFWLARRRPAFPGGQPDLSGGKRGLAGGGHPGITDGQGGLPDGPGGLPSGHGGLADGQSGPPSGQVEAGASSAGPGGVE